MWKGGCGRERITFLLHFDFSSEVILNEKAQEILQVSLNNFIVRIFFKMKHGEYFMRALYLFLCI